MNNELYTIGAYHEAGHAVLGYYFGFQVKSIALILNEPGSAVTKFDYGKDHLLITGILNAKTDLTFFKSLPKSDIERTPLVCDKIYCTLIGGPIAEAIHKFGISNVGRMEIGIKSPDVESIEAVEYVLSLMGDSSFRDRTTAVEILLRSDKFWTVVSSLSSKLLDSNSKSLVQSEIEGVFQRLNFQKHPDC